MKIHFLQTGGFVGLRRTASLDSALLPPGKRRKLEQLVADAKFFELPPKIEAAAPGADRFQYTVTVELEDRRHTVEVCDGAVPPALEPLLEPLKDLARSAARGIGRPKKSE